MGFSLYGVCISMLSEGVAYDTVAEYDGMINSCTKWPMQCMLQTNARSKKGNIVYATSYPCGMAPFCCPHVSAATGADGERKRKLCENSAKASIKAAPEKDKTHCLWLKACGALKPVLHRNQMGRAAQNHWKRADKKEQQIRNHSKKRAEYSQ